MREEAEAALREGPGPAVAATTLTLELGIDLGELERVIQLGAPYSAPASFSGSAAPAGAGIRPPR